MQKNEASDVNEDISVEPSEMLKAVRIGTPKLLVIMGLIWVVWIFVFAWQYANDIEAHPELYQVQESLVISSLEEQAANGAVYKHQFEIINKYTSLLHYGIIWLGLYAMYFLLIHECEVK